MQQVAPAPTIFLREEIHVHPPRFSKKKTTSVVDELVGKRLTELAASLTTVQKLESPIAASPPYLQQDLQNCLLQRDR
jgi:hypothetical protein